MAPMSTTAKASSSLIIDWQQFKTFLLQRICAKAAGDYIRYAKQFHHILQTGNAQELLQLSPDKRLHVMKALSSLSKYEGRYNEFLQMRQKYNLKWSHENETINTFQMFFDDSKNMDTMMSWVKQAILALPKHMSEVIKWTTLLGLRPAETIHALKLIKNPETFKTYYNAKNGMLEHFRFPQIFMRRTKVVYVSIIDREQLSGIANIGTFTPTYNTIRTTLAHKGMTTHMAYCRKIYASWLRQHGIGSEIIDLLQGRIGKSIFMKHYYRPSLEYRDRVLECVSKLNEEIR